MADLDMDNEGHGTLVKHGLPGIEASKAPVLARLAATSMTTASCDEQMAALSDAAHVSRAMLPP